MDQRVHPSNSPLQTRKNYVSTLFAKLGMKQRTQAAAYAARTFAGCKLESRQNTTHMQVTRRADLLLPMLARFLD
jgi:hypothetical protein